MLTWLYPAQAAAEAAWPWPRRDSNFNLSLRDLLLATVIAVLGIVLARVFGPLGGTAAMVALAALEPALIAFPFNVAVSAVYRTPRFWHPEAVEPKLLSLLDHFENIKAEALAVLSDPSVSIPSFASVSPHQKRIAGGQPWRVFPLFVYETFNDANCARMPVTSGLLRQMPSVKLAMLSILEQGASIPMHCGFFKGVVRVHLTLHTDTEDTTGERFIEVGGETYSWKEREMVAFDDTFPHRVVNRVPGRRVVLFLDLERPAATVFEKNLFALFHSIIRRSASVKRHAANQETVKT